MATHYGKINEFDSSIEERDDYIERLNQFFIANKITEEIKKKAILLSGCSACKNLQIVQGTCITRETK